MTANNHPNRNWRRVMHAAADDHVAGVRGSDSGAQTPDQIQGLIRAAYVAGYTAGRTSRERNLRTEDRA